MDPEGIMLGEIYQTQRDKNYIPLIHAIKEKSKDTENRLGCQWWGWGDWVNA